MFIHDITGLLKRLLTESVVKNTIQEIQIYIYQKINCNTILNLKKKLKLYENVETIYSLNFIVLQQKINNKLACSVKTIGFMERLVCTSVAEKVSYLNS